MANKGDNGQNGQGKATTTAIGPTIVIKGKLKSDEDLIVRGRIEAEISSSKALLVENSGVIKANVKVKSARISGVLVGNITAEERVEIAPDGRMVGDLTAPKIIINDGAAFRGRIDMQNFDEGHESKSESKSEARPEPAPKAAAAPSGDHPSAAAAK
jgi:cytoskeletal protein CcmA (bactofilin family)